ncbi:M56 family metallopeptidase [Tissierella sp.]|uniref:M56 family metallopeptidase n=1 Tax=Tissierella sp. TaxID=41274 RepID=UPI0028601680|nr:M56 family metallopeptidase [Tissierella sp.]MDR7855409.1 M56 family metallopeptidase [Tissierella sp.]
MDKLFLQIINMSITSSYVILFVLILRFFLKKAPKVFSYGLWSIVFFRLVFPFSFESIFSLISINTKTIPEEIIYTQSPQINSGIVAIDRAVNNYLPSPTIGASVNPMEIWIFLGQTIWLLGIGVLIIYTVYTSISLSKRLKSAKLLYGNVFETNNIKTPFVFGLVNPKIYLPTDLSQTEMPYIIKHEETHIKRYDHILKLLCFLIVSVHWFNPLVWLSFFLMSKDMELSCDEKVLKEMGPNIKKDYSNSLLTLATGKRIIGGSPLAFGENNTKGRIKNILNYKKPGFWMTIIGIVVVVIAAVGLLSNPKEKKVNSSEVLDKMAVEDYAKEFINQQIAMYEDPEGGWQGFKIIDSKITKLEKLVTFDNILSSPVEIWSLEFRLKPDDITKVAMAGGMQEEDGWITDDSSMGKPFMAFANEGNNMKYLGAFYPQEFGFDTLAKQEISLRIMLESKGLLPNESYKSDHVVIRFPLSTGEISQLLLSQPVDQGDKGIWVVERWMDGNGNVYHEFPDTDLRIEEKYKELQMGFNNGENLFLGDPVDVGMFFIHITLGQVQVKETDLTIINPAKIEDFIEINGFNKNPSLEDHAKELEKKIKELLINELKNRIKGHLAGYIVFDGNTLYLDEVEIITREDKDRAAELDLKDIDMPNGYYIHNPSNGKTSFELTDETSYSFTDYNLLFVENPEGQRLYTTRNREEFMQHLTTSYTDDPPAQKVPFFIEVKDGKVISIIEEFIFTQ